MPGWLAGAAAVIVPSLAETSGLVAFDIDNFPALIGSGGFLVVCDHGHLGLWHAAEELLADGQ